MQRWARTSASVTRDACIERCLPYRPAIDVYAYILGEGVSSLQTRNRAKELSNLLIHDPALTSALEQPRTPRITILLCTFNGERFLAAQLASIEQQTHWNWHLIVSDDGSTDSTLTIIQHFAQRVSQPVDIRRGPRRGPAANFVALAADPSI
jgi:cellulose synthase/poly-beta-1,6-N-acetylglucosamine synthase-like glycosyltransferase